MSRVLVTGASGFVGRPTVDALVAAGHEVHGVARSVGAVGAVKWHAADLLADPASVVADVRPEILVHLAWSAEHGRFWTDPANVDWVASSATMLRAFAASGGRRAVIAGTCAEYDWSLGGDDPLDEARSPVRPATLYGAAKAALHDLAAAFMDQEGLELAWGRVFFPYGAGEAPGRIVAAVAGSLLRGEVAETSAGTQVRDFIHVDDVGGAFAALAGSDVTGAVNIGTGAGVVLRDLIAQVAEAAGRPDLVRLGALPMREGEPRSLVADVSRLRGEVGFEPAVDLASGIAAELDALRA